jgi:DNA-cytosine methyltransferase
MQEITVVSLFDGIAGALIALKQLGFKVNYYASEIDEYAIRIAMKNHPEIIQLGDVRNITAKDLPNKIDLLIGGFPCQDLSIANSNGKGLEGDRSILFYQFKRILDELGDRLTYFVGENVESMKTKDYVIISNELGVRPIMLDASLVSAQRRKRYFWTNIPNVKKPTLVKSKLYPDNKIGLVIADILDDNAERKIVNVNPDRIIETSYGVRWNTQHKVASFGIQRQKPSAVDKKNGTVDANVWKSGERIVRRTSNYGLQGYQAKNVEGKFDGIDTNVGKRPTKICKQQEHDSQQTRARFTDKKNNALTAKGSATVPKILRNDYVIEQLTWLEIERLAGLPEDYTDLGDGNRQEFRGKSIGNGFQIDILRHLLSFIIGFPEPIPRTERPVEEQINLFE